MYIDVYRYVYSILWTKSCASVREPPSLLPLSLSFSYVLPPPRIVEPRHAIFPGFTPVSRKPRWNGISGRARSRAQTSPLNSRRAKTSRSPLRPPLRPSSRPPFTAFSSSLHSLRTTARQICTLDRPRLRDRGERETGAILSRWENEIGRDHAAAVTTWGRNEKERGGGRDGVNCATRTEK